MGDGLALDVVFERQQGGVDIVVVQIGVVFAITVLLDLPPGDALVFGKDFVTQDVYSTDKVEPRIGDSIEIHEGCLLELGYLVGGLGVD